MIDELQVLNMSSAERLDLLIRLIRNYNGISKLNDQLREELFYTKQELQQLKNKEVGK